MHRVSPKPHALSVRRDTVTQVLRVLRSSPMPLFTREIIDAVNIRSNDPRSHVLAALRELVRDGEVHRIRPDDWVSGQRVMWEIAEQD